MRFQVALLFFPLTAWAGSYCEPARQIYDQAEMCEDNYLFVQAADRCAAKLTREVNDATANLAKKFVRNDGQDQSLNFNSSVQDYQMTSDTFARLIALNRQALADVREYYPHVIEPEDMDELGDKAEEWASGIPCWFRTRKSILHVVEVLETKLKNLETAKAAADAFNATSGQRERHVDAATNAPVPAKATVGQGAGKRVPSGKSSNGKSDITGVDEAKKKRNEGEAVLEKK